MPTGTKTPHPPAAHGFIIRSATLACGNRARGASIHRRSARPSILATSRCRSWRGTRQTAKADQRQHHSRNHSATRFECRGVRSLISHGFAFGSRGGALHQSRPLIRSARYGAAFWSSRRCPIFQGHYDRGLDDSPLLECLRTSQRTRFPSQAYRLIHTHRRGGLGEI